MRVAAVCALGRVKVGCKRVRAHDWAVRALWCDRTSKCDESGAWEAAHAVVKGLGAQAHGSWDTEVQARARCSSAGMHTLCADAWRLNTRRELGERLPWGREGGRARGCAAGEGWLFCLELPGGGDEGGLVVAVGARVPGRRQQARARARSLERMLIVRTGVTQGKMGGRGVPEAPLRQHKTAG